MGPLQKRSLHFVGIGGVGMRGLAELLHNLGGQVTGSDLRESPQTRQLAALGIPVFIGHSRRHIGKKTGIVVYSGAIKEGNPELAEARRRGLALIHRAEALAEMMRLKRGIVVAGTHGKTTATALLASIFSFAGKDPTVVAGGRLDMFQSTARLGKSPWFIAESDESDGSFHHLFPELALLTNIDDDHVDFYGSFQELKNSFSKFLNRVPFYGSVIACGDCPHARDAARSGFSGRLWLYGFGVENDFRLGKKGLHYTVSHKGEEWGELKTPLWGAHNALNGLGALVCAWQAGLDRRTIFKGLESFQGVERRMERKGHFRGIDFFDDYGHHPTEVEAVLSGLRERFPARRKVVLFQPHRYTRLKRCWERFLSCFSLSDRVYVCEVYPAGEEPIEGIDSENFARASRHPDCRFIPESKIAAEIPAALRPGDIFITLGAGSVYKFGGEILRRLKQAG